METKQRVAEAETVAVTVMMVVHGEAAQDHVIDEKVGSRQIKFYD
jgi:hypothetical protein